MRRREGLIWLMLADSAAFPAIVGLARLSGYTLRVGNGLIYAIAATALYVFCAVLLLASKDRRLGRAATAALYLLLPLNPAQALFFILFTHANCFASCLLFLLWFWVTAVVTAVCGRAAASKTVVCLLSALLVVPTALLILLTFLASGFGSLGTAASAVSPGGTFRAEVIESDEGALGGSETLVVYRTRGSFTLGSFDFRRDEREITRGPWQNSVDLTWIDEEHVIFCGRTYDISYAYQKP